jgi:hypothetical protein
MCILSTYNLLLTAADYGLEVEAMNSSLVIFAPSMSALYPSISPKASSYSSSSFTFRTANASSSSAFSNAFSRFAS